MPPDQRSYLIGADGGRWTVRKALDIAFEGYTHPERFLVLTTPFSFDTEFAQCSRNYFSDPDEWCALFKVTGDDGKGLWRVLFPTRIEETDAQALDEEAVQRRLQTFFPKPGPYPVVHRNLYNVHQRVAASFGQGRVFLAGDSAHVEQSAQRARAQFRHPRRGRLSTLLGRVLRQEAPSAIKQYDRFRRPLNVEYVRQQTIANKQLEEKDRAPCAEQRGVAQDGSRSCCPPRLSAARITDRQRAQADDSGRVGWLFASSGNPLTPTLSPKGERESDRARRTLEQQSQRARR